MPTIPFFSVSAHTYDYLYCSLASHMIGGCGSHMLAMDEKTYKVIGEDYPGNRPEDVKNPGLLWMMGFTIVVSFLGLFSLVPLRKVGN